MMSGFTAFASSKPMPSRSTTPGRKFWITTSAVAKSFSSASRAPSFFRSRTTDRLLRLLLRKEAENPPRRGATWRALSPAGASTSDDPTKITDGSNIIGGVTVHPDGSKLLFAASAGDTTDLTEYTLSDDSEAVIGEKGDEQGAYFAGGDGLVVNRDTFDADSEIVVTDGSGTLVTRVTDDSSLNTSPAVNSKESDGMDPTVF